MHANWLPGFLPPARYHGRRVITNPCAAMSYISNIIQACPAIQSTIEDKWISQTPYEPMPLIEYLASPANRTGIELDIIKGNGQLGVAEVTYFRRFLDSQGAADVSFPTCTGGEKFGNEKETYTFDTTKNVATPMQLVDTVDAINACADPQELLARHIARHMDLLRRLVAAQVASEVYLAAGNWSSGVSGVVADELVLKSLKTDGESIDPRAIIRIQNALQDSGFPMATALFGGGTAREYFQALQIGCCSNEGLNVAEALTTYGKAFGYDWFLKNVIGDENGWLAVMPQAVQLLNWSKANLNAAHGNLWIESSNYLLINMRDPQTGLIYDFEITNNCGQLSMRGIASVQPIFLPNDLFQSGDHMQGVNGVAKGTFENCPAPECAEA
jgi:hypothetical protein